MKWAALSENITSDVRLEKIQISLHIHTIWLKSLLGAYWIANDAKFPLDCSTVRQIYYRKDLWSSLSFLMQTTKTDETGRLQPPSLISLCCLHEETLQHRLVWVLRYMSECMFSIRLFSGKKKKNIWNFHLPQFLPSMLSIQKLQVHVLYHS